MNTNELARAWIAKAESDIKNIENNLRYVEEEIPIDTVCFHCQQAVEKYLKAYLTKKNISFPHTHNLGSLVYLAESIDSSFSEILEKAETLSPFAVEIRYPDYSDIPSAEECKEFYQTVIEIKEFILDRM